MLLLSFNIGTQQYAIAAKQIIEILPLTRIQKLTKTPDYVAGLLDFRGRPVPVIDLCQLVIGQAYNKVLSSRIILVNYIATDDTTHVLGLIAEKVTETMNIGADKFTTSGISMADAPFLGQVAKHNGSMLQYIEINELLPEQVQQLLFQNAATGMQMSN